MSTVFSKIIAGEIPGRIVYQDDTVAAFLTIEPVAYGHTLVVPVEEIDKWTDIPAELWSHMNEVAQNIGAVIVEKFNAERAGYLIAGFEVPHAHIHVFPANDMSGYTLSTAMRHDETDAEKMDAAADTIREALRAQEAK
ncbi:HIT-like protein [Corynebacterium afermentans subsp. afermentans]|uniref:Histidine triad (HIT) family protein n=2 Tax=Corynebacterium TaxID=1716 RepID=A0A9X8R7A5_9CORY|nr:MULTISPECIES: HIT family protein [Corynebacterium]RUQ12122.1 HIT family protein [Corynebacterium genitalium]TKW74703.1 MAG: HIT family protein [Staphylococcus hominis]MCG7291594.1 HIT family protein [Corynebacterium afermentans]OAA15828.1 HIT family hydrolase [Corynebacterium afermentans subsp. afermentans]WCZ35249.1 HIT-like protein [Corynebacterium ihumii]